jgi:hypothetical protein
MLPKDAASTVARGAPVSDPVVSNAGRAGLGVTGGAAGRGGGIGGTEAAGTSGAREMGGTAAAGTAGAGTIGGTGSIGEGLAATGVGAAAPQCEQNLAPSAMRWPQCAQNMENLR